VQHLDRQSKKAKSNLELMQGVAADTFDPKGVTIRAQAVTVQIRLLELLGMIDK
jgi:hypothetical protein